MELLHKSQLPADVIVVLSVSARLTSILLGRSLVANDPLRSACLSTDVLFRSVRIASICALYRRRRSLSLMS